VGVFFVQVFQKKLDTQVFDYQALAPAAADDLSL